MNNRRMTPMAEPGVLDFAPGAAAAYSLRNLSSTYAGPVVTVRRSTDDAEADFTASEVSDGTLAGWAGADGFVKTWWDQSGNARHATQATTTAQPQIVDGGVLVTEGGKAAVRLDGVDDFLSIGTLGVSGNNPRSVFGVLSPDSYPAIAGDPFLGVREGASSAGQLFDLCIESGQLAIRINGNAIYADTSNNLQQRLWSVLFSSGLSDTIKVYKDGGTLAYTSGSVQTVDTVDGLFAIGAGNPNHSDPFFHGTISELIIYPTDQTALRTRIEGSLAWYY
jgi:hypothetical protein